MEHGDLIQQTKELLVGSESVLLATHVKPDGDAIASLLAMRDIAQNFCTKDISVVSHDGVPAAFSFLAGTENIKQDFLAGDIDLVITLDCGDLRRTGFGDRIDHLVQKGVPLINIDHHPKNDLYRLAKVNMIDQSAASTTQILFNICQELQVPITPNLATYLFTGLYTDTGSFQHIVTTPEVLRVASVILAKGAKAKEVHKHIMRAKSVPMLKLWGRALERIKMNKEGLTVSVITQKDLKVCGASEEDIAGVLSLLETTEHCRVALLLTEMSNNMIKGSMRSNKSKVDVSRIAAMFGGGGHTKAAGFVMEAKLILDKHAWNIV